MTATNQNRPTHGTAEQARQQASRVGQQTAQAGGQIGHAAAEQGRHVAAEARQQARNLTGEAGSQLRDRARSQQHRAAEGLRGLSQDLVSMADRGGASGLAGDAVRGASDVAQRVAGWIDEREPGDLLNDVRGYARQHPGVFLAGAATAGLLAGRLARNMTSSGNGHRGGMQGGGMQGGGYTPSMAAQQQEVNAPYVGESPYAGAARAQNVSPAGQREPDMGRVAP
ncbi:hypothetical protein [Micromonospora thermarum]|uniref:DUF3618 domain-containing protein n=1 Tax=Micromonospora thermarum TaxID=2720024 RepID=A0ABX0Z3Q8_9ACTN|nr:hypothetical protein [Micromonospora thermarum]NJP31818.1 hypothetical protein [Micromonospora thermarum]